VTTSEPPSEEDVRLRLLDFYSKKGDTSATNLLALAVVLFTAVLVIEGTHNPSFEAVFSPGWFLAAIVLAAVSACGVYILMRDLWWGALAGAVLPYKEADLKAETKEVVKNLDAPAKVEYLIKKFAFDRKCNFTIKDEAKSWVREDSTWLATKAAYYCRHAIQGSAAVFVVFLAIYGALLWQKIL
jgi:hypothetical protein